MFTSNTKSYLNKILLISSVFSAISSAQAFIQTPSGKTSFGAEVQHYQYREPNLMKLKGWLGGVNLGYTYLFSSQFFTSIEGRALWGSAHYSSNGTGKLKHEPQFIFETRLLLGHNFPLSSQVLFSPYTGFGYRYKSDHSGGRITTTGHSGYDRISQYIYLPFGVRTTHTINKDWNLAWQGEFDLFLKGRQESKIKGGLTHRQNKGYGLKANIEAIKKIDSKRSVSFGPYIHFWDIKKSNVNKGFIEPDNKTIETGFALKFHF
ncbi:MAG TPA: hypothetical protein VNJ29_00895 [Candidatus Nitrosotenuis sp.]|jgi:hypothetical protein|nr:hypothetical protein [Candidatus Nitrosotenuis sp.]